MNRDDVVEAAHHAYVNARYGPLSHIKGEYIPAVEREAMEAAVGVVLTSLSEAQPEEGLAWLNMLPRAVVARFAFNDGCREQTSNEINSGLYGGTKLKAEMVVEMIGDLQKDTRTALSRNHDDALERAAREVRDAIFDSDYPYPPEVCERLVRKIRALKGDSK